MDGSSPSRCRSKVSYSVVSVVGCRVVFRETPYVIAAVGVVAADDTAVNVAAAADEYDVARCSLKLAK